MIIFRVKVILEREKGDGTVTVLRETVASIHKFDGDTVPLGVTDRASRGLITASKNANRDFDILAYDKTILAIQS